MEFRKLIRFGNSSYVVSIPKKWIKKNQVGKGDIIYLEEDKDGNIVLSPKEIPEPEPRTFHLDITTLSRLRIKREVSSAYINNYQYYELRSKKPLQDPLETKEILTYYIGLEVMEETSNRILVKDFVDVKMISIEELIKKMDLLLQSMFQDLKAFQLSNLLSREKEIDKLFFLVRKLILYHLHNPSLMKLHKKTTSEFLLLQDVTFTVEEIGDEIKYLTALLQKNFKKEDIAPDYFELLDELHQYYAQSLVIVMSQNYEKAIELSEQKAALKEKINKTFSIVKLPLKSPTQSFEAGVVMTHMLRITSLIHHALRSVYTHPSPLKP